MADHSKNTPEIFELNNGSMQVKISNYGATITSLSVPDKNGSFSSSFLCRSPLCFTFLQIPITWSSLFVFSSIQGKLADVVLGFDSVDPYVVIFLEFHLILSFNSIQISSDLIIKSWSLAPFVSDFKFHRFLLSELVYNWCVWKQFSWIVSESYS